LHMNMTPNKSAFVDFGLCPLNSLVITIENSGDLAGETQRNIESNCHLQLP
jgi:hypothetical protein